MNEIELVKLENVTEKCVILANKDEFFISICNEENHD